MDWSYKWHPVWTRILQWIPSFFSSSQIWSNWWWQRQRLMNATTNIVTHPKMTTQAVSRKHTSPLLNISTQYFTVIYVFHSFLRVLCFSDNMNQPDKTGKNYDSPLETISLFNMLTDNNAKFKSPSEHLAAEEVIVLFKQWVIFKQYFPKEHKHFGIKSYKLCNMTRCACDMNIYLERNWYNATQMMTATQAIWSFTSRVERIGHIYVACLIFFLSKRILWPAHISYKLWERNVNKWREILTIIHPNWNRVTYI